LRIAGATGDPVFASDAVEAVHFYSRGIPRVMNLLCEHALINAYVEQIKPVAAPMVEEAARDLLMDEFRPFTTDPCVSDHSPSRLKAMQSVFAKELARPSASQESPPQEAPYSEWAPVPAAFGVEEPASTAENSLLATIHEREEIASSGKQLNGFHPSEGLQPALPQLKRPHGEQELSLDSIACHQDSAAELVATMKRMLTMAPPTPAPHVMPARGESKPLPPAKSNRVFTTENRALTLETINRIPHNRRLGWIRSRLAPLEKLGSSLRAFLLPAVSPAAWSHISATIVRWSCQPFYPAKLLQYWVFGFKRDWIAMMNAFGFRQMKTSLLHWLRQPVSSKSMASGKN